MITKNNYVKKKTVYIIHILPIRFTINVLKMYKTVLLPFCDTRKDRSVGSKCPQNYFSILYKLYLIWNLKNNTLDITYEYEKYVQIT